MALLIKEKLPTKRLIEREIIKITVWTFMVSELIQDLEISVQISVFNLPKSLSFPRKKVSAKHFSIKYEDKNLRLEHISPENRRDKPFGPFDSFRKSSS